MKISALAVAALSVFVPAASAASVRGVSKTEEVAKRQKAAKKAALKRLLHAKLSKDQSLQRKLKLVADAAKSRVSEKRDLQSLLPELESLGSSPEGEILLSLLGGFGSPVLEPGSLVGAGSATEEGLALIPVLAGLIAGLIDNDFGDIVEEIVSDEVNFIDDILE